MLGEIEMCEKWVSGLPCPQRSRACRKRFGLRCRLFCLSSLLLLLALSRSPAPFRGDMEI